jgi:hypothetical protein
MGEKKQEKKKKRKKRRGNRFPTGKPAAVLVPAPTGLPQLLCAIKSYFENQSLNLMHTLCVGGNLVG